LDTPLYTTIHKNFISLHLVTLYTANYEVNICYSTMSTHFVSGLLLIYQWLVPP